MTSSLSTNGFSESFRPHEAADNDDHARRPPARGKRSRRRRRNSGPPVMVAVGVVACVVAVVAAPLAVGGVHRPILITLMATTLTGLLLLHIGLTLQHRTLRLGATVVLPLVLLAIPILQSAPLPLSLRGMLDPVGNDLLVDNLPGPLTSWPLSLDPANTRVHIGRAASGLAAFIAAFHIASGQKWRHLLPRALGLAGVAAVVIGLAHRVFGITKLFGLFISTHRTLIDGPFVNANHTAEFLELAAFVCLACSFQRATALNRVGWLAAMLLCAAGALATLSRGAAVGISAGLLMFIFLRHTANEIPRGGNHRRRATLAWGVSLFALVAMAAIALGGGRLLDRFHSDTLTGDIRFRLWRDAFRVLAAHPAGIGRGAFDRVFPIYRTMQTGFPLRFSFVESEPYQLLIDSGWFLFALLIGASAFGAWIIFRHRRRDKTEAALISGLVALLLHSVVDFGLETLGILLPFMGVLGMVLGRSFDGERAPHPVRAWLLTSVTAVSLVVGIISTAHSSYDDFDVALKKSRDVEETRAVLRHAQQVHPVDYFYPLAFARTEPLRPQAGSSSPRLHALNRALRLCPGCAPVHIEIARNLWTLGLRRQALSEWRHAVGLETQFFTPVMRELFAAGAKPEQLASLAASEPARMVEVADFLAAQGRISDAFVVLDQADILAVPRVESLLTRGKLQLQAGQIADAQTTVAQAHAAGIQDPRLSLLDAEMTLASTSSSGADDALRILDAGAIRYPTDVPIQRMRVDVVMKFEKWQAAERAVEGLKMALFAANGSATEAMVASARIQTRLSQWTSALGAYRIALAEDHHNASLWVEFARAAERAGHDGTAREAYTEAARLTPNEPSVRTALRELDDRQAKLRAATPAHLEGREEPSLGLPSRAGP